MVPSSKLSGQCPWISLLLAARHILRGSAPFLTITTRVREGGFWTVHDFYGTCICVFMQMPLEVICEARQGCLPERNVSRKGHTSCIAVFFRTHTFSNSRKKKPTRATILKTMGDVACWVACATRLSMLCCDRQSCKASSIHHTV